MLGAVLELLGPLTIFDALSRAYALLVYTQYLMHYHELMLCLCILSCISLFLENQSVTNLHGQDYVIHCLRVCFCKCICMLLHILHFAAKNVS